MYGSKTNHTEGSLSSTRLDLVLIPRGWNEGGVGMVCGGAHSGDVGAGAGGVAAGDGDSISGPLSL